MVRREFEVMLEHLIVENLVLVDRIEVTFSLGLNVLSGETGAGKSVLIKALSLLLGSRAQTDAIRSGADEASVEGQFLVSPDSALAARLVAQGIQVPDGTLIVRRTVPRNGRGRVLLNGQMATASMLQDLLRGVLDITSQHEHVSLLDADNHLNILDGFGQHATLVREVDDAHAEVQTFRAALDALEIDEAEKARREDYLKFALDEITSIDPKTGEIEHLEEERKRLRHLTDLIEGVRRAESILYADEGAVVDAVGRVERELDKLSRLDDRLSGIGGQLRSVSAELEDLVRGLSRYQAMLSADPERLESVEDRLEQLRKLSRKYGGSVESILASKDKMVAELDALEHDEVRKADLAAALEAQVKRRDEAAKRLSEARHKAVRSLERAVQKELADLSMAGTRFEVALRPLAEVGARGQESAEFEIAPNAGEPLRPLRKIASGGELSRILLAVKQAMADRGAVGTFVFDEVDTGIGGAVAEVLGAKLKAVAGNTQVICVTHLPQIAAYAQHHLVVEKAAQEGRTVTHVRGLSERERIEELARMLGGMKITDRTRGLAQELRARGQGEGPRSGRGGKARREGWDGHAAREPEAKGA